MLLEFTVGNYRSFAEPVVLSMLATKLRETPELDERAIVQAGNLALLRSAAIYGANASGKSNLLRAMMTMRRLVLASATRLQADDLFPVEPFRFNTQTRAQPSHFQIIFLHNGTRYRYGFEADRHRVLSEWLYRAEQRERRLFVRESQEFAVSAGFRREAPLALQRQTRSNALFLSVLAQFNSETAIGLLGWFRSHFRGILGLDDQSYMPFTLQRLEEDSSFRQRVATMMRFADMGILDLSIQTISLDHPDVPEAVRQMAIRLADREQSVDQQPMIKRVETAHALFDGQQQVDQTFLPLDAESDGTRKFLALLGPMLDALEHGRVLVIDELEARLHPLLVREVVRWFNDSATNPHNAQLIFVTHDAGLLGECLLRRDQIWFTQKNRYGATELYSLAEMKERNDALYLKQYLAGRYGGIPLLHSLRPYVEQELAHGARAIDEASIT